MREYHVRFCEGLGVKFPGPTRHLLGAAFFLMIITGGWEESILSYVEGEYEGEGALRVPSWPARWTVLAGSALAMINYLVMAYIDVVKPDLLDSEVETGTPL